MVDKAFTYYFNTVGDPCETVARDGRARLAESWQLERPLRHLLDTGPAAAAQAAAGRPGTNSTTLLSEISQLDSRRRWCAQQQCFCALRAWDVNEADMALAQIAEPGWWATWRDGREADDYDGIANISALWHMRKYFAGDEGGPVTTMTVTWNHPHLKATYHGQRVRHQLTLQPLTGRAATVCDLLNRASTQTRNSGHVALALAGSSEAGIAAGLARDTPERFHLLFAQVRAACSPLDPVTRAVAEGLASTWDGTAQALIAAAQALTTATAHGEGEGEGSAPTGTGATIPGDRFAAETST